MLVCYSQLTSQVTIGSGINPISGALLDLKETSVINGANSTKGLLYPRVYLTDANSLVDIADGVLTAPDDLSGHTGLTVYNVNTGFASKEGLNVWSGTKWMNMKADTIINIRRDTISVNVDKTYLTGFANDAASLLNIGIEGSAWKTVAFKTIPIDSKSSYNTSTGIFSVPTTGAYDIYARYTYSGVSLLSTVGVIVYKKAAGQSTFMPLYEDKITIIAGLTGGVRVISASNVPLNGGDQLVFGLQSGGIALSIASGAAALGVIKEH